MGISRARSWGTAPVPAHRPPRRSRNRYSTYGNPEDRAYVGDWDGTGTIAVRRGNTHLVRNSLTTGTADGVSVFGAAEDTAFVSDWDGDRRDSLGIVRNGDELEDRD